jgi:hypothetical protein
MNCLNILAPARHAITRQSHGVGLGILHKLQYLHQRPSIFAKNITVNYPIQFYGYSNIKPNGVYFW